MIYGKTSIKNVMANIFRDLPHADGQAWQDYISWISDGLSHLLTTEEYSIHHADLEVIDYRAKYPKGFNLIQTLAYHDTPLRYGASGKNATGYLHAESSINLVTNGGSDYYTCSNTYISTSFRNGKLSLDFWGVEVDDEGFMLVPDSVTYREALVHFVDYKIGFKQWRMNEISRADFEKLEDMAQDKGNAAMNEASFPDINRAEGIKNMLLRLTPVLNSYDTFFVNLTSK